VLVLVAKTKPRKDAGPKAYANTPRPEDAAGRRFAAPGPVLVAKTKPCKDAGPKAYANTPRPEDAAGRWFAAPRTVSVPDPSDY
jgi:hypothetical protein